MIGDRAFIGCNNLKTILVSSDNPYFKSVEGVLFNKNGSKLICYPSCKKETSYIIPDNVKSVGDSAFSYCSSLSSITLPNSVTSIGDSAFLYCSSLLSVTLPNSVTSIDNSAFSFCYIIINNSPKLRFINWKICFF